MDHVWEGKHVDSCEWLSATGGPSFSQCTGMHSRNGKKINLVFGGHFGLKPHERVSERVPGSRARLHVVQSSSRGLLHHWIPRDRLHRKRFTCERYRQSLILLFVLVHSRGGELVTIVHVLVWVARCLKFCSTWHDQPLNPCTCISWTIRPSSHGWHH